MNLEIVQADEPVEGEYSVGLGEGPEDWMGHEIIHTSALQNTTHTLPAQLEIDGMDFTLTFEGVWDFTDVEEDHHVHLIFVANSDDKVILTANLTRTLNLKGFDDVEITEVI